MLHNTHFYTRLAARESIAARSALTDAAKLRHRTMAEQYMKRAEQLREHSGS